MLPWREHSDAYRWSSRTRPTGIARYQGPQGYIIGLCQCQHQKETYEDFGHQYKDFVEDLDPGFPELSIPELGIDIYCDSDHDLVTGRSITGIIAFVSITLIHWKSTRQKIIMQTVKHNNITWFRNSVNKFTTKWSPKIGKILSATPWNGMVLEITIICWPE